MHEYMIYGLNLLVFVILFNYIHISIAASWYERPNAGSLLLTQINARVVPEPVPGQRDPPNQNNSFIVCSGPSCLIHRVWR